MKRILIRLVGAAVLAALALGALSLDHVPRLVIGIVLALPSFVLMIISRRHLGSSFSAAPEAKALVTTGLYSKIQHPMYLFLNLFLLALIITIAWPVLLWIWGILVVVQLVQGWREEQVLASTFGADYSRYSAHTWF
jgi:protein-S-isoprenylcysteine O-methyltransferase Ste14